MSNTGFGVGLHGLNAAAKTPRTRLLHPRPQPRACTPGPGGIGQEEQWAPGNDRRPPRDSPEKI
jgi:hypothetical protein